MQEMIGDLILKCRIKDPRVSPLASITRVEVSRDLSYADVYVSCASGAGSTRRCAQGLQSAAGFVRARLGEALHIRKIPALRFIADSSVREGFDMVQKIEALSREALSRETLSREALSRETRESGATAEARDLRRENETN